MEYGTLYITATPIGNMKDITLRAIETLREHVDIVFCEDTRQTRKLLNRYDIPLPTYSLHAHSSEGKITKAINLLKEGKSIAYITDAGTPGISDPGSRLVHAARNAGITVSPLPGPSAASTLVSVAGFEGKRFIFAGFLSKKPGKRKRELSELKDFSGIIILYESPYRIKKLLLDITEIFPDREILIGREMTKHFEEFIAGKPQDIKKEIDGITEKGEFSIAINNFDKRKKK